MVWEDTDKQWCPDTGVRSENLYMDRHFSDKDLFQLLELWPAKA